MLRSQSKAAQPTTYNLQTETIIQTDDNKYQVTSMTSKNKAYEVTILDKDIAAFSCPDFEYRARTCKHIIEVLVKVLMQVYDWNRMSMWLLCAT